MFISQREAEERLREERNLFRDPLADPGGVDAIIKEDGLNDTGLDLPDTGGADGEGGGEALDSTSDESTESTISLSHLDNLLHPKVNGRANYRGKLESQVAIAETEIITGNAIARRTFGLSSSQTQAYSEGRRSTSEITYHTPPKPELVSRIKQTKERLAEIAGKRLELTLNALTPQKILAIKRATNISKVAKDMAVVMDKCTPKEEVDRGSIHFHVWRPEMVSESSYKTVNVGPTIPAPDLK